MTRPARTPLEPRGLTCAEAAAYLGIGATLFKRLVFQGKLPPPLKLEGRRVWDRRALDDAVDRLQGRTSDAGRQGADTVPAGDVWDNPRV